MRWRLSHRFDPAARPIADRHYNRRTVGSPQFVPPGRCVVLLCDEPRSLWVTSWPMFSKHAWPGAWVNSTFRKEGGGRASELIVEALAASRHELGEPPAAGLITFVDPAKVRHKRDPGRCYLRAGFELAGTTTGGHGRNPLLVFRIRPERMPPPDAPLGAQGDLL